MKKNNQNSLIILLIVVILGLFAAYYFIYIYMNSLGQQVYDLKTTSEQKVQQEQEMNSVANSVKMLTDQMNAVDSYFIPPDGEVAFIEETESQAKTFGLTSSVDSVAIENSNYLISKHFEYLILKVSTTGTWADTYRFLSFLSNLPYQLSVDHADITVALDNGKKSLPVWSGVFSVRILEKSK
jgi:hypothetical protein